MRNTSVILGLICCFVASCVPTKRLEQEQSMNDGLRLENKELYSELERLTKSNADLGSDVQNLKDEIQKLQGDTSDYAEKLRIEQMTKEGMNRLYQEQVDQNKRLLESSSDERDKLTSQLEAKGTALSKYEVELNQTKSELDLLQKELEAREEKVNELERLLNQKEASINELKTRIENALLGFKKDDLNIEIRDGKIYVSLAEKLLFKSGSIAVDSKGKEALSKLASVLEYQPDIQIIVEGHTDNVPIKTASIKDNWDLSVLRATSIVRILTANDNVKPEQVIPSGRSEYLPVESNENKQGKAKNRRTEIILSPNLDEVFKILESDNAGQ